MGLVASLLAGKDAIVSQEMRTEEDEYYYSLHDEVRLPAYRVIVNDGEDTRYYVDPTTAALLRRVNANDRAERWLFSPSTTSIFPCSGPVPCGTLLSCC